MLFKLLIAGIACLPLIAVDDVFAAIRGNDITRLKALTPAELPERDKSGVTPVVIRLRPGKL